MEGLVLRGHTAELSITNKLTLVYHIELTKKVLIVLVVLVPKLVSSNQRPCPQVTKSGEMRRDKQMGCWLGETGVKWKYRHVRYI